MQGLWAPGKNQGGEVENTCIHCERKIGDCNKKDFCLLGYTQNPQSYEAIEKVYENKGVACQIIHQAFRKKK
jgi:hypothetical protein